MSAVPMERLRYCITALDPESRALLELSLRRGVPDLDIARLLGVELDDVDRRRERALAKLGSELGLRTRDETDELRSRLPDLPRDVWVAAAAPLAGNGEAVGEPQPEHEPMAEPQTVTPRTADPERGGSRGATWALLAVLLVVVVGALLALTSGDDSGRGDAAQRTPAAKKPAPAARLRALPGAKGGGRATVTGGVLRLRVTGMAPARGGFYEAWVYNSLADVRPLGRLRGGALSAKLPPDARRYRFVDISREPADGNPNHGGASVVRVPLGPLLGR